MCKNILTIEKKLVSWHFTVHRGKFFAKVNLKYNNKQLEQDNQVKYLGTILDSNQRWQAHIHEVGKKNIKRNRNLSRLNSTLC